MLKYLSYISEQSHMLSDKDVENLLVQSRASNKTKGITGLLIYFEGVFTQFLEGPQTEIDALYQKIAKDRRHKQLRELFSGTTTARFYGDWSMAYKALDQEKASQITGYRPFDKSKFFEPVQVNQVHPGVMLLESFVDGLHFF